jgi:hypothetical protein
MRSLVFGDKNLVIVANQRQIIAGSGAIASSVMASLYVFLLALELLSIGNGYSFRGGRGLRYQIKLADVGGRIVKTRRQTTCGGRPKKMTKKPAVENCRDFKICSRPAMSPQSS